MSIMDARYGDLGQNTKVNSISVVIPIFNEEESAEALYGELSSKLLNSGVKYEILFVDDGSSDGTMIKLREILRKDKNVRVIRLRRNYGQSTAMDIGFRYSSGEVIITMDADGQNDPADIPSLLVLIESGYDVVSGWRKNRNDPLGKKLPSKISNWLARRLTKVNIHDSGCTLKAYRRNAVSKLRLHGEAHRYIPALLASQGFLITEAVVNHRKRKAGRSKYGVGRLIRGSLDLLNLFFITSYLSKPIQFFGKIGFILLGLGTIAALYKIAQSIFLNIPLNLGPLLLLAAVLFLTGLQFVLFGFLSEIQSRTHMILAEGPQNDKVLSIEGN